MIAVITGDIVNSRYVADPDAWMSPLKQFFCEWGDEPHYWEFYRGDSFQLEVARPEMSVNAALRIKAIVKSIKTQAPGARKNPMDVRIGIGIGEKTHDAARISEKNGSAFIRSGEIFDAINDRLVMMRSGDEALDQDVNLMLKLSQMIMESWSTSSAELVNLALQNPGMKQDDLGEIIGISQNSVSGRAKRGHLDEIMEMEAHIREKIANLLL